MDSLSTSPSSSTTSWSLLITILIIILILIIFIHEANKDSNTSQSPEDIKEIDRLERNFLAWITVASIFLAAAIIIKNFLNSSSYYSIVFFIIVILLLTITNADYLQERKSLDQKGIAVFPRLDYLFLIVTAVIIICVIIIYNIIAEG